MSSSNQSGVKEKDRRSIVERSAFIRVLVGGSVILLVLGFLFTDSAVSQTAFFAAAAVLGILARVAQASVHHKEMMNELRRR